MNNFELIGVKRTLLNNTLCRKVNWIGQIPKRNWLFHDAVERQMTSERSRKKKNRVPWRFNKQKKIFLKGGNNSLSHEHKEEIQVLFHKSMELLTTKMMKKIIIIPILPVLKKSLFLFLWEFEMLLIKI